MSIQVPGYFVTGQSAIVGPEGNVIPVLEVAPFNDRPWNPDVHSVDATGKVLSMEREPPASIDTYHHYPLFPRIERQLKKFGQAIFGSLDSKLQASSDNRRGVVATSQLGDMYFVYRGAARLVGQRIPTDGIEPTQIPRPAVDDPDGAAVRYLHELVNPKFGFTEATARKANELLGHPEAAERLLWLKNPGHSYNATDLGYINKIRVLRMVAGQFKDGILITNRSNTNSADGRSSHSYLTTIAYMPGEPGRKLNNVSAKSLGLDQA